MKRIAVFCGSSIQVNPVFIEAARNLGRLLAFNNIEVVYGGAAVGLMGQVADGALEKGGHVIGVMPDFMSSREINHQSIQDLRIVKSMHERKQLMADLSDGFIALPGGFGTLDELFEIITWKQINLHMKPIGILNVEGYFDSLIAFADKATQEGFVQPKHRACFVLADDAETLIKKLIA
jgi:uncharacterized protein (TIGR00730 family)